MLKERERKKKFDTYRSHFSNSRGCPLESATRLTEISIISEVNFSSFLPPLHSL